MCFHHRRKKDGRHVSKMKLALCGGALSTSFGARMCAAVTRQWSRGIQFLPIHSPTQSSKAQLLVIFMASITN